MDLAPSLTPSGDDARGHLEPMARSGSRLPSLVFVMGVKLPSSFTSLYRLFLRASSASVLHHRVATHNVQILWKSTFREAAVVIHKLQSPTLGVSEKKQLERWRSIWELSSEFHVGILFPVVKVNFFCSGQEIGRASCRERV